MHVIWLNFSNLVFLDSKGNLHCGSFKSIVKAMLLDGIEEREIEDCFNEMDKNEDNFAEFGIYKTFMLSLYKPEYGARIEGEVKQAA